MTPDPVDLIQSFLGPLWIYVVIPIVLATLLVLFLWLSRKEQPALPPYEKKKDVFGHESEKTLFALLNELYGNTHYVFPQVHYDAIIQPRQSFSRNEWFSYWNKINRKSADFVLVDKATLETKVVIELDGSSHNQWQRQERDAFIDSALAGAGVRCVRLDPNHVEMARVKGKVDEYTQLEDHA